MRPNAVLQNDAQLMPARLGQARRARSNRRVGLPPPDASSVSSSSDEEAPREQQDLEMLDIDALAEALDSPAAETLDIDALLNMGRVNMPASHSDVVQGHAASLESPRLPQEPAPPHARARARTRCMHMESAGALGVGGNGDEIQELTSVAPAPTARALTSRPTDMHRVIKRRLASFSTSGRALVPQRESLHQRCRVRWLRLMEYSVRGVTVRSLLIVAQQMVMPVVQTILSWSVTVQWYRSGNTSLATASAAIHILSGILMGLVFARNLTHSQFGVQARWYYAYPVGLLVGTPGLAKPAATFVVGLYAPNVDIALHTQLPLFEITSLTAQTLPLAILKTSIGFVYGWSELILVSLCVSVMSAGVTVFRWEALARDDVKSLRVWTRYGVATVMLRTTQASLLLSCCAILECTNTGLAIVAVVIGLCSYCGIVFEPTFRVDGLALRVSIVCLMCFFVTIGSVIALFMSIEPEDNNFQNTSLPPGPPGHPQHFDCRDIQYEILVSALVLVAILSPLSWVMDPLTGVKGCRAATWNEQIEADSDGLNCDQIADLKLAAVWRWASVYKADVLEPWEIYRLAQGVAACGLGGRMRRTTSSGRNKHDPMFLKAQQRSQRRLRHTVDADTSADESDVSYSNSDLSASSEEEPEEPAQLGEDQAARYWHYQALCR